MVAVQGKGSGLQDAALVVQGKVNAKAVREGRATRRVPDKEPVVRGRAIPMIHKADPAVAAVLDVHNLDFGPGPADLAVRGSRWAVAEEVCCRNRQAEDCRAGMAEQVSHRTEDIADIPVGSSGLTCCRGPMEPKDRDRPRGIVEDGGWRMEG